MSSDLDCHAPRARLCQFSSHSSRAEKLYGATLNLVCTIYCARIKCLTVYFSKLCFLMVGHTREEIDQSSHASPDAYATLHQLPQVISAFGGLCYHLYLYNEVTMDLGRHLMTCETSVVLSQDPSSHHSKQFNKLTFKFLFTILNILQPQTFKTEISHFFM